MLPDTAKIGLLLRLRRRCAGLTQRQAAKAVGCSQPYICQVERGQKALSAKFAEALEAILELEPGRLSGQRIPRGRPVLCEPTRLARRQLLDVTSRMPASRVRRSRYRPANPPPGYLDPLSPLRVYLGPQAADEVRQLEVKQAGQLYWRRFNSMRFDSLPEKRFLVRCALEGLSLLKLRPAQVGCSLRVTNPKSGKCAAYHPSSALVSSRGDTVIAAFPQLSVWTGLRYRRPDLTVVITRGQRRVTAALEVDGRLYHSDPRKERQRDLELGVPVYHLEADQVGDPEALERFYEWCERLVA